MPKAKDPNIMKISSQILLGFLLKPCHIMSAQGFGVYSTVPV